MSDYLSHAKSVVAEACKKLSPAEFIKSEAAVMSRDELEHLASAYLLAQVKMRNRAVTLNVERDSERVPEPPRPTYDSEPNWGTRAWAAWAEKPENEERASKTLAIQAEKEQWRVNVELGRQRMLTDILDKYRDELRMEWTSELLNSEFALGDGTTVRWGDATMEQHEYRYQLHARNAQAGLEGAARHREAIATLNVTGAATLREAVAVAA